MINERALVRYVKAGAGWCSMIATAAKLHACKQGALVSAVAWSSGADRADRSNGPG